MISYYFSRFCQILQEAVFPPKCLACAAFYRIADHSPGRRSAGSNPSVGSTASIQAGMDESLAAVLCPDCLGQLINVESPLCLCCGLPFKSRQGPDHHCGQCLDTGHKFGQARAALVYEPVITKLIHCFKYLGKTQLTGPFGELLLTTFINLWDRDNIDIILPVPLHPGRFRRRGFNQAYLLSRNWPDLAVRRSFDMSPIRIERDVLVRKTATAPQTALSRDQRAVNIKNAFDLNPDKTIVDERILLIDDVYTTGATANECAGLLIKGGAQRVDVLTLARAV